ncbi:MAG: hypothetical protein HOQ22_09115 [Nocardioidaceae bacterium]|nr:hypothetical protein [Nocardioidaceae bacterium]NUS51180.1 hypothetical protein [Nocardioidaceae bacterium]
MRRGILDRYRRRRWMHQQLRKLDQADAGRRREPRHRAIGRHATVVLTTLVVVVLGTLAFAWNYGLIR